MGEPEEQNAPKWKRLQVFDTIDSQEKFFDENSHWKKHGSRPDKSAFKVRYYCNVLSRTKGIKCPAQLELHVLDDGKFVLYENGADHKHDADGSVLAKKPLTEAVKKQIDRLVALKTAPRLIYHELHEDENIVVTDKPTKNQVSLGLFLNVLI